LLTLLALVMGSVTGVQFRVVGSPGKAKSQWT